MDFGKVITAMITPFDANLEVDWNQTEQLIDYLIEEQQNDSIVICGTTGESPTLTDEEKIRLFETAVRVARGRCKVIAGTGSNDTRHSLHLTQEAERAGVDGILLVAPYYNKPSQEGLYQHFRTIAEASKLPVMLYNVPGRSGINVETSTTLRLAELPNVVASKEAHGDLIQIARLVAGAPAHFKVYSGDDTNTLPFLSVGAYGIVSVASHIIGKEIRQMVEAFLKGDVQGAAHMHGKLLPVFDGMFNCPHRVPNPAPIKHALKLKGFEVGNLRLPLVAVTEEEGRFIQALLN